MEKNIKDKDMIVQIEKILTSLKKMDKQLHYIIIRLLQEVYREYNSGRNRHIDRILYDLIDIEVKHTPKEVV